MSPMSNALPYLFSTRPLAAVSSPMLIARAIGRSTTIMCNSPILMRSPITLFLRLRSIRKLFWESSYRVFFSLRLARFLFIRLLLSIETTRYKLNSFTYKECFTVYLLIYTVTIIIGEGEI